MFEVEVKDVFKITGRGYVIAGEIIQKESFLRIGDTHWKNETESYWIFI